MTSLLIKAEVRKVEVWEPYKTIYENYTNLCKVWEPHKTMYLYSYAISEILGVPKDSAASKWR